MDDCYPIVRSDLPLNEVTENNEEWCPWYFSWTVDLARLLPNDDERDRSYSVVIFIIQALARLRSEKTGWFLPKETLPMQIADIASACYWEESGVLRTLNYLHTRGMAIVKPMLGPGWFKVVLLFDDWEKIKDSYKEWSTAMQAVKKGQSHG